MKFGRLYQEHLASDGYPQHWLDTSISYRQLKKVIKRVEKELADIGLDIETLRHLLRNTEEATSSAEDVSAKPLLYSLGEDAEGTQEKKPFRPQLLIAVDDATGEPLDVGFTPETLRCLHELAVTQKLTDVKISETASIETLSDDSLDGTSILDRRRGSQPHRMIEVALTSDSEFFNILQKELNGLKELHCEQETELGSQITQLGSAVAKVARPDRTLSRSDIALWRQIFQLYLESQIFFATSEQDHGSHDYERARTKFQLFLKRLQDNGLAKKFRKKESAVALQQFLQINNDILRALHFQELNHMALTKILKKFDKRTAFGINKTFTHAASPVALSQDMARAICYRVNTDLLSLVPQLDDYLCPICCDITWRPVRLACSHVFCIRCLVVLQREKKTMCPMCREKVLMQADVDNIDAAMSNFLKCWFPREVKAKQRSNEQLAGMDLYGEHYQDQCNVM